MKTTYCEPTILWRLSRPPASTARAVVVPTWGHQTLVWWVDDVIEGAEDFAGLDEVLLAADGLRRALESSGWRRVSDSAG